MRWNSERDSEMSRCSGPELPAVMYGRLMFVVVAADSSIFAFSAASRRRCIAILSCDRSMPFWPRNVLTR